ncbi:hypothetical protein CGLO_18210 [Colletotrichum gloeosporioides Cg-14]|nr:hypothetical protein CGLO_18210 [Colletotrichum gloeosporioides Cg-14]
MTDKIVS